MKTLMKNALIGASVVITLAACSPEKDNNKVQIDANQKMNSQELANAGEQLMMPHTLNLADRVFEMALEKDPENLKAQFYRAFLKRFMVFKGILTRMSPYVQKYGNPQQFERMINDIPNHPAKEFLLGSSDSTALKPIQKASDIQALLVEYRKAIQDLRSFIIQHADANLDLYLNPLLFQERISSNLQNSCTVTSGSSQDNIKVICDTKDIATVKVNMADLMALKQYAAGEIFYVTLYTSYSVGDIDELINETKDQKVKSKDIFEKVDSISNAGLLMQDQGMTAIRELGSDFKAALKWAIKYQDTLCPKDANGVVTQRKGFLIKNMCIDDQQNAQNSVAVLEKVLAGTMKINLKVNGSDVEKNMNFMTLFDRPVRDLRRLMPVTWNNDGTAATSFKDSSFGGLFPDGDLNDILKNFSEEEAKNISKVMARKL
ncbi:MAG: hypothetical protein ACXVCY_02400 [Pseudobdellovibrionaceae bacterium]